MSQSFFYLQRLLFVFSQCTMFHMLYNKEGLVFSCPRAPLPTHGNGASYN